MALPPQRAFLRPILEITAKAEMRLSYKEILAELIPLLSLNDDDLQERTPHGALRVEKHTRYSMHLLKRGGLLDAPSQGSERGRYRITEQGHRYLSEHPDALDPAQLNMLAAKQEPSGDSSALAGAIPTAGDISPDEQIEVTYEQLRNKLADELLEIVKAVSPERFEDLVVDLLVKIGYGRGRRVGRTGDGGIDGIVTQDRLGFEKVYVQAKRWDTAQVGEPEIRKFSGSLDPHGATRGVFITTSRFSEPAKRTADYAARNNKIILLIDGPKLARLMIEYGVGVVTQTVYEIKEIDENYFTDG
ncbi:MAG: restriction endonuclease [Chloroflexota bacterium]|nr:restriction endonuclease [Chloroflexota bacterium]MDE2683945.1 restriction endonuclease [Chloroflexota bacterium]